jgi:hypothetical protein
MLVIESSFNQVYGGAVSRSWPRRILLYWSVLTLGPIGVGVFTSLGFQLYGTHNLLAVIMLWVVGAVIAALRCAELRRARGGIPHAGGEYAFLSKLYHPVLGFLSGWVSFFVGFFSAHRRLGHRLLGIPDPGLPGNFHPPARPHGGDIASWITTTASGTGAAPVPSMSVPTTAIGKLVPSFFCPPTLPAKRKVPKIMNKASLAFRVISHLSFPNL